MDERRLDPEFSERMEAFLQEVRSEPGQELPARTRSLAVLAALLGCQGLDEFRRALPEALEAGLAPVEVKEAVYQAVDYLGIGRVRPFLTAVNEILLARGVALPLPGQATTTMEDRLQKGEQAQVDIFGEGMRGAWKQGHVNRWLAANCFGDSYTRGGLDLKDREMITFCFLAAQGGCEPQLTAHAGGNMNLGNDEAFLTRVVSQCLPYIGYPRSLNALACVRKAAEAEKPLLKVAQKPRLPRKNENLKKDLAPQGIDKTPCAPYSDVGSVRPKLSPEEQTIVDALSGGERLVDDVIAETGLSTGKLLSSLTMLELKGIIKRLPGKRIVLSGK